MRILVTGAGGFIGWHLLEAIAGRGDVVQAWARRPFFEPWAKSIETIAVDITESDAVSDAIAGFSPQLIIHMAAQSFPTRSWEDPALTYKANVVGLIHLLEAVRALPQPPRILVAGSSAEYAEPIDGRMITEDSSTSPNSPYGCSKLAADQLAQLYQRRYGLDIVRFRAFYLAGPRKAGDVCSDFARRIVAIENGADKALRVGSLDVVRDIIDVRDGVTAIMRLAEAGKTGEVYNICGGRSVSIGQILKIYRGLAHVPIEVSHDPALLRPLEQKAKVGDPGKLQALGWKPEKDLGETLAVILEYWRSVAKN